jgi:hypothetical protein
LVVQRDPLEAVYLDSQHSASNSSTMTTASEQTRRQPTELLIPEARQHQRWRYVRSTAITILAALVIAATVAVFTILSQRSSGVGEEGAPLAAASATAASSCRTFWAKSAPIRKHMGNDLTTPPSTPLPPYVVGDVGEQNAALLFAGSGGFYECFVKSPSSVVGMGGSPDGSTSRSPSVAHPVTLSSPALFTDVGAKFQVVTGQAARGVTSITLKLSDSTMLHPALGHGYFIAWWPGTATVVSSAFVAHGVVHHSGGAPSSPPQQLGANVPNASP